MNTIDKILLIDNNSESVYFNKNLIEKFHLPENLIIRDDINDALIYLEEFANSDSENLLILLNLQMPGGFHFLYEFERRYYKNIFIGILTDFKKAEDIVRLRKIGNYDIIIKPLTEDNLLNINHRYFGKYHRLISL